MNGLAVFPLKGWVVSSGASRDLQSPGGPGPGLWNRVDNK